MKKLFALIGLAGLLVLNPSLRADEQKAGTGDNKPPEGFTLLFNGKDLTGWQGLVELPERSKLSAEQLAEKQKEANEKYLPHWTVKDGILNYDGKGQSLQTAKDYANFELWVDWKIAAKGDSGIYLRGNPQVQIWDNKEGSGGLYNNPPKSDGQKPLEVKDKKPGEWNHMYVKMIGANVTVVLNGVIVVDNAVFLQGKIPDSGPIELQVHGTPLWFRNVFVRELK